MYENRFSGRWSGARRQHARSPVMRSSAHHVEDRGQECCWVFRCRSFVVVGKRSSGVTLQESYLKKLGKNPCRNLQAAIHDRHESIYQKIRNKARVWDAVAHFRALWRKVPMTDSSRAENIYYFYVPSRKSLPNLFPLFKRSVQLAV